MNYETSGILLLSGLSYTSYSSFYYVASGMFMINGLADVTRKAYSYLADGKLTITGVLLSVSAFKYEAASGRLFRILGIGPIKSNVVIPVSPPENLFLLQGPKFRELPPKTRPKTFAYDHQSVSRGIFNPRHGAYVPEITARSLQKIRRADIKPGMDLSGKIVVD